jgi:hypothetical protein
MSSLSTLPKGDSAWLLRKSIQRIMQQVSVLETNIGSSTTGNSANTQVIFNDAGTLRGDAGLTYNKATDTLSTGSATITGDLTVGTGAFGTGLSGGLIGNGKQLVLSNASSFNTGWISNADNACIYSSGAGGTFAFNGHLVLQARGSAAGAILFGTGNGAGAMSERYRIASDGVATWSNVGGVAGTAMTLNSTGLGVGVTPVAGQRLTIEGGNIYIKSANKLLLDNGSNNFGASIYNIGSSGQAAIAFVLGASQAMTLDASGNLIVGNTAASAVGTTGGVVDVPNSGNTYTLIGHTNGSASGSAYLNFFYNASPIGSITQNGTTGVLYNISSDYRLKESVAPLSGGLARVNALKPSIYKWKSDGSNGEGFIAHELAEVVPFAVTGEKDAVNEDGSIKSQGIDMSRIVPILVAAIKELTARVEALEAKLA